MDDVLEWLKSCHCQRYECGHRRAVAEIERLRTALALAVGELSTHGQYEAWSPEMLMDQFLQEAEDA